METPITAEQLAAFIVANFTIATWDSRNGLTPVRFSAAELVAAASNQTDQTNGLQHLLPHH